MASTLAHEINQPLTAIANYLEATRAMIGVTDDTMLNEIAEALELAAAQSLRAGGIVRRLRAFVDGGDAGFKVEPLDMLVEKATSLGLLGAHEAGIAATMTIAQPRSIAAGPDGMPSADAQGVATPGREHRARIGATSPPRTGAPGQVDDPRAGTGGRGGHGQRVRHAAG